MNIKYPVNFTGFGGQVDFIRGAAEGIDGKGKPIIALQSINQKTKDSKIVPVLKPGAISRLIYFTFISRVEGHENSADATLTLDISCQSVE